MRVPIFAGLSTLNQDRVAGLARPLHLGEGEVASQPGSAALLMVVHTGRLKISRLSADGSEQLIRVLGPGEFAGEAAVLSGRSPDDRAIALGDSRLCVFRHEDLAALIKDHPEIGLRMLTTVVERLSETEDRLNALTTRGVESRLADYLLALPRVRSVEVAPITLPLAKKDIASLLDTTPESLSRALKGLASKGAIAIGAGRSLSITRPDLLQQIAAAD